MLWNCRPLLGQPERTCGFPQESANISSSRLVPVTAGFILSTPCLYLARLATGYEVAQRFEFQLGQTLDGPPVDLHLSRGAADDYAFRLTRLLWSPDRVVDTGVVGLRSSMDWEMVL
jgi:hypothetical protein